MSAWSIDGKKLAEKINSHTGELAVSYKAKTGRRPSLVLILVGEDLDSAKFIAKKKKLGESLGIRVETSLLPSTITRNELSEEIKKFSQNTEIDAVLLQLPLPNSLLAEGLRGDRVEGKIRESEFINLIPENKDVDGITSSALGSLLRLRLKEEDMFEDGLYRSLLPCTPAGVLYLIQYAIESGYGVRSLSGAKVLVVGRSALVGSSTALVLQASDATVTVAHSRTRPEDLKELSRNADIIVSASGVPSLITDEMVTGGCIMIDVGLTYVEGKGLLGDIDQESCKEKASAITPVPGGVGPMTLAMLMRNVLICAEKRITNNKTAL